MKKTCEQCNQQFEVEKKEIEMLQLLSPTIAGIKFDLPEPTFCPVCRIQNRLAFRNEHSLYKRKSDLSGKAMLSIFAPDSTYKAIDQDEWWSDEWEPLQYGRDFDFSKTVFEQLGELNLAIPHMALSTKNVENSQFTNFALNMKNCYLVFGASDDQDCLYCRILLGCKDAIDCFTVYDSEIAYEGISSKNCYSCMYFKNCRNCSESLFIEECDNCKNCLLCFGLRNKEYYYMNEYVGKEKFEKLKTSLQPLTHEKIAELHQKLLNLKKDLPHIASHIYACEDCSGDMIFNSKNCQWAFDVSDCENCYYIAGQKGSQNSMDITYAARGVRFSYQLCAATGCVQSIGCFLCWDCSNTFYSIECQNTSDVFACIGLRRKQYCILNKQYSKEEYEKLVPKIIEHMQKTGEWGQFLAKSLSHFSYNQTVAQDHYPLEKAEALKKGWQWRDEEKTSQAFNITPKELEFYKKHQLPQPILPPNERYKSRLAKKNPMQLWERTCAKCNAVIQTTFAPNRPEKIYCEKCYLEAVY